jgi:hypothetical protein
MAARQSIEALERNPEGNPLLTLSSDPMRDITRRERRALLTVAVVQYGLFVSHLAPKIVSIAGVSVEGTSAKWLPRMMLIFGAYLLTAFSLYSWSDLRRAATDPIVVLDKYKDGRVSFPALLWKCSRVNTLRLAFEFALPVVIGIASILWSVSRSF